MGLTISLLSTSVNSQSEPLPKLFEFMPRAAKLFLGATGMFCTIAYTNFPYQHGKAGMWNVEVYFWISVFMFLGEAFSGSLVHQAKDNRNAAHLNKTMIYVGVVGFVNLGFLIFRVLPGGLVDLHGDIGALIKLVFNLFTISFSFSKSAAVFNILRIMKRRVDAGEDAGEDASLDGASSDLNDGQTAAKPQQPGMDIETEMTTVSTPMHNDGDKDTIPVASKA